MYFKDYAHEIKKIFSFSRKLNEKNSLIANEVKKSNSISIHIRRGDYLLPNNNKHNTDLKNYYLKAIESTSKLFTNPKYFIFTDDPSWVTKNFTLNFLHIF